MKYPITITADGYASGRIAAAASIALTDAWRFTLRNWGLLAVLAVTFAVHAPTLAYFFDGDDFVVLGSAEYLGGRAYIIDTFLMRDIVPNWRPLTGAIYAVEWEIFGLNATAWRSVNLSVHLTSVTLLYTLVLRVTHRPAIGAAAALIFGISGAHFDTVTYITALPHVLATCLVLATLLALVSYVQDGERNKAAYALSFGFFTLAFLANEGAFVYAPALVAAYAIFSRRWQRAPVRLVLHAVPFTALALGWFAFYQSCTCTQLKFDDYYWGPHVFSNYAVYASWIAFPVRSIPADPGAGRLILAMIMLALAGAVALRGTKLTRLSLLFVGLALLPYAPVEIWTASRYSYAAVAFTAPVAAVLGYAIFDRARRMHRYARPAATVVALALVATVAGLYAWQTHAQNARSGRYTERWELLVTQLQQNYSDVPDGTTIYIVDGPWTNPMEQYTWVPSVARAVYGNAAAFNLPRSAYQAEPPTTRRALYLEWHEGGLRPIELQQVVAAE